MIDATTSRARLRGLATPGRFASPRQLLVDASRIAEKPPRHPKSPSPRPGSDDLIASIIR